MSGAPARVLDAHFHVFDPAHALPGDGGYQPPAFDAAQYRAAVAPLGVRAGVLVAASTHGLDPAPLLAALAQLGPGFVAVAAADPAMDDAALRALAAGGVRGVRFILYRGAGMALDAALDLADRAHAVAGLHAQFYADAAQLAPALPRLTRMASRLVIDHLGMTESGLPVVLALAEAGAKVKATGFGRVELDVVPALRRIFAVAPGALLFGTDLPSTRARRPFEVADMALLRDIAGDAPFWENGASFYGVDG
ncbi:amidohydrolase family protein [Pseudoroseomonas cervicalis]|uniref:amidohydrolase family protein n=1 Tax=Teichococcus cervicalis TaxID=204525 RepID=UPI0022F1CE2C|nr:amidohydrolase family protein [Pseudoroseomonas cervicalis]WBV42183.1 amidohydrolase family protein [Pseudoroseomonas cervicalis]